MVIVLVDRTAYYHTFHLAAKTAVLLSVCACVPLCVRVYMCVMVRDAEQ